MHHADRPALLAQIRELEVRLSRRSAAVEMLELREAVMDEAERVAGLGSWSWDVSTGQITWSQELYRILGYDSAEVQPSGEAFYAAIHPNDRQQVIEDSQRLAERPAAARRLVTVCHADGTELIVELGGVVVRDGSGRDVRIVGTMYDVTRRILLERGLLQVRKMEALGRLAGGVAHDFNNLLTVILGNAQLIEHHACAPSAQVQEITHAAQMAARLTKQLLDFSRQAPAKRDLLDVSDIFRSSEEVLRRLAGERVEVNVSLAQEQCWVFADAAQLEQVVLNLVVNACDAMPSGGAVRLVTQNVDGEVLVSVSDDGAGMSPDTVERAFEPLFSTKPVGAGTGLGLSTVLSIVQRFGGRVLVDSTLGQGTTMRVYLPAASAAS